MPIHKYINSLYSTNSQHFWYSANVSLLYCWHKSMNKQALKKNNCIVMFISVPGSGMIESQMQDPFFRDSEFPEKIINKSNKREQQQHTRNVHSCTIHSFTALIHSVLHFSLFKYGALRTMHFSDKFPSSCVVLCLGVSALKTELLGLSHSHLDLCCY